MDEISQETSGTYRCEVLVENPSNYIGPMFGKTYSQRKMIVMDDTESVKLNRGTLTSAGHKIDGNISTLFIILLFLRSPQRL